MSVNIEVKLWPKRDQPVGERSGFVKIADAIQINIIVMKTNGRYWVKYPSYKKSDGTWQETAGPVGKEVRDAINEAVTKYIENESSSSSEPQAKPKTETVKSGEAPKRDDPGSIEAPW